VTIQSNDGPLQIGPADFQRTDRGERWAIKCRALDGMQVVIAVLQQPDGSWGYGDPAEPAMLDPEFHNSAATYPLVADWMRAVLIPRLNAWLRAHFGSASEPAAEQTRFEQADKLIRGLWIAQDAEGYLVVNAGQPN